MCLLLYTFHLAVRSSSSGTELYLNKLIFEHFPHERHSLICDVNDYELIPKSRGTSAKGIGWCITGLGEGWSPLQRTEFTVLPKHCANTCGRLRPQHGMHVCKSVTLGSVCLCKTVYS